MSSLPQPSHNIYSINSCYDTPSANECSDSHCKEEPDPLPRPGNIVANDDTLEATVSLYKILDTSVTSIDEPWGQIGKGLLVTQSTKERYLHNDTKQEVNTVRPGDILEWRQVELDELTDDACKPAGDCIWGAFTGVMRCMNTPVTQQTHRMSAEGSAVKRSNLSLIDPDRPYSTSSTPSQEHVVKPLGSREGLYPTSKAHTSNLITGSPFVQPSSLSPRTPRHPFLTNIVVSPSCDLSTYKSSNSMIIKQPRPKTSDVSPSYKSYRPRNSEDTQPVEVKLDGLGGAIITFTPLASSLSRTVQGVCHTVDCSPRRCFPKTTLSFNKRATLCTHSKDNESEQQHTSHDNDDIVASNEAPNSPSHAVVHTAQMHGNSLSKTKKRSIYRTINLTPTRNRPTLRLDGLSSSSPASQSTKHFTISEGIMVDDSKRSSPVTTPLKLSMDQRKSTHLINEIAKVEATHQIKEARFSTHVTKISNIRDAPVNYDSFIETPLQTRDRNIMHSLSLSPIELCSLGLHNGRTMTHRAKTICTLRKCKHQ